jgi:endonuclease/exonuclease/phosphatase family metal-dependent hydrolase
MPATIDVFRRAVDDPMATDPPPTEESGRRETIMRIVNWNIEWMNDWFVGGGSVAFREDNLRRGITDVDDLCRRVASVVNAMDPDVLTLEEGPSDIREMQLFVDAYLSDPQGGARFDIFGGLDGGAQKLYALVKIGGEFTDPSIPTDDLTLALDEPWESDVDGDFRLDGYEFTRQPLVIEGTTDSSNAKLRIVTLHTKSKYVHNGQQLWENLNTRMDYVVAALKNRRRISSEAMRVRRYLDDLLGQDANLLCVVCGDFNDGPGIDYFETRYLTHNVTDILLGSTYYPDLLFEHALVMRVPEDRRYTAIFDDFVDDIENRHLLLDHLLVSPALSSGITNSGIAHEEYDAAIDPNATGRQAHASDHRPVYLDL